MEEIKKEEDKMASVNSKDELIQAITDVIKNNGNHEITGNVLHDVLLLMVDFLATDGSGKNITVCLGNGKAKGNDGLHYDDQLSIKGDVYVFSGGISCEKDATVKSNFHCDGYIGSKEDIHADKNLEALGELHLGEKGMPSSIYIFDKSNPSIQYRVYVNNGSLVCEQV